MKLTHLGICHVVINNCRNFRHHYGGLQWHNIHTKFSENLSVGSVGEIGIYTYTHQHIDLYSILCFSFQVQKSTEYYLYKAIIVWVGEAAGKNSVS